MSRTIRRPQLPTVDSIVPVPVYSSWWMRGAKYARVVSIGRAYAYVSLLVSGAEIGKTVRFRLTHFA